MLSCAHESEEARQPGRTGRPGRGDGARIPALYGAARRARRDRLARSRSGETLAAGADQVPRGRHPDQPAAHLRSDEAVPIMGERQGVAPERDRLCGALAAATDAAIQPKQRSDDRTALPNPLGVTRAFREEARAPGGESEPRAGIGGDPAVERPMDLPSVRWDR